jgi:oligosaccharyltransferase complex subunit delta (ribophorin II)
LERTYEAVRTFQILGLEKYKSETGKACKFAAEELASPASSAAKDLFHAARISGVLGCSVDAGVYDVGVSSRDLSAATRIVMFGDVFVSFIDRVSWQGLKQ